MKLYVTRHGETAWNAENIVCGTTDLPLNDTGRAQALETGAQLADTPLDLVVCSPMLRARQTAELICQGRDLPLLLDPRLREQDYGEYEGGSRFDEGFLAHKKSFATRYPGGESHMVTARRVYGFLEDAARAWPDQRVLVVCHGGVCRVIESYFHDMTNEEFFLYSMGNCEVREYDLSLPQSFGEGEVTFYGTYTCPDCREALSLFAEQGFTAYRYVEITESTRALKEFLRLRDTRAELGPARAAGKLGVPCFLFPDGTLTLDPGLCLEKAGQGTGAL